LSADEQQHEPQRPTPEQEEEALRQRVDEQLRKVRVQDLLLESVAGILNLSARRIAKDDERDLEQARVGIEAVRAVVGLLEPEPAKAVRDALSELQVLYARQASGGGEAPPGPEPAPETPPRKGEPPPRLWTPPGSA
jgi:hypothetical protein